MANPENLTGRGFDERTAEERREIVRSGARKSGQARRRKRELRQTIVLEQCHFDR